MKNLSKVFNLFLFVILSTTLLTVTSCKKDDLEKAIDNIEGKWNVKSFTIDGAETIGNAVIDFEMDYDKYENNKGDFKWALIYFDNTTDALAGEYTINEEGNEIDITIDGETSNLDMTLDKDDLTLQGNIDGSYVIIRAEK